MLVFYNSNWSYYNPVKVIFGVDAIKQLPSLMTTKKGLLITTPGFTKRGLTERLSLLLKDYDIEILDEIEPNPDIKAIEGYWHEFRERGFQFLIGVGGGSVLDTTKALSYLLNIENNKFSLKLHFENKTPLPELSPLCMVAVPTTAGTGSEVTPFATIWDMENKKKYSLAAPNLYPNTALLDPGLTLDLPKDITIATGLDALSHALESIWNRNANFITFNYAVAAADIVLNTLPALVKDLANLEYRSKMLNASLLGGLAISSTRTALAHSISYPITALVGVPHGFACSFTLPELLDFNAQADDGRISMATRKLGFNSIGNLKAALNGLFQELEVTKIMGAYWISKEELLNLSPQMLTPGRSDNNLRPVDSDDIQNILTRAYDFVFKL